jgi:hypothetical protein
VLHLIFFAAFTSCAIAAVPRRTRANNFPGRCRIRGDPFVDQAPGLTSGPGTNQDGGDSRPFIRRNVMPQYMLSVHDDGTQPFESIPQEELQQVYADVNAFNDEVRAAGKWVFAGGLEPIETSTVVDGTVESPVITDGPFSESKEQLGGFWVITAADLDEALDWATRGSKACHGKVEVRPFAPDAG